MSSQPSKSIRGDAPFAYEGLERVIHEKARLGILASLVSHGEGLAFSDLKQLCALTDGNLNRHLQVLQDAGLVDVRKDTAGKRPQTRCQLTTEGRRRFVEYIGVLEQIVGDALSARHTEAASKRYGQGLSPA
ncbi:MAG: ArsR family transcriptional regulator [Planctomycetota bacterium]|nr:MAG: ArsR family transcriptional regulator [Planctomycetota bacterium]